MNGTILNFDSLMTPPIAQSHYDQNLFDVEDDNMQVSYLERHLMYPFKCMCSEKFTTVSGLADHRDTCELMKIAYGELFTMINQFYQGVDQGQLRNLISVLQLSIESLGKFVDAGYQQKGEEVFPGVSMVKKDDQNEPKPNIGQIEEEKKDDLILDLDKEDQEKAERIEYTASCKICLEDMEIEMATMLYSCDHVFHTECLQQYFQSEINQNHCPLVCPVVECRKILSTSDIKQVLSDDLIEKYEKYSILNAISEQSDIFWCPNPECNYAFSIEDANADVKEYHCEMCGKHYCLNCQVPFHEGMTCKEYKKTQKTSKEQELKAEKQFRSFVKSSKTKQCPFCKFWVEKSRGCDHMKSRCGKEFCYKCGDPYPKCLCTYSRTEYLKFKLFGMRPT